MEETETLKVTKFLWFNKLLSNLKNVSVFILFSNFITVVISEAPLKTAIPTAPTSKSKEGKPPPNVPVHPAQPNDHTMREVESIRFEGSKE